jgi:hypothetical protein
MKRPFCLYLEATYLQLASKGHLHCLCGVVLLSKSSIAPRIRIQPPQKPKLISMKNTLLRVFLLNQA